MLLFLPVILMLATALALAFVHYARPQFKYPWLVAAGGSLLALTGIFLWRIRFPQNFSLPSWQPGTVFTFIPTWLADGFSWPYGLALAALAVAVILTSLVRNENEPMSWAGTLVLCAFGLLAVTAANPLTLALAWSVLDVSELVIMLRSTEGEEENRGVVIAFAVRLAGLALLLWADVISAAAGIPLLFLSATPQVGVILLLAAGLRLGVLPLHLPYRKENVLRRGFGTTLRLVSAAASLVLLARIPTSALQSPLIPYLILLAAVTALYSGWMWLRSSDEIVGRPYWVMAVGSLAVAACLRGSPAGSAAWGSALVLGGALLFLFSARKRSVLWLPLAGLWLISSLPFSITASAWQSGNRLSFIFTLPFLPAQAFLMVGYLKHTFYRGETSLESQESWISVIYPVGLFLLAALGILLGFWGWQGALTLGAWWTGAVVLLLSAGLYWLSLRYTSRFPGGAPSGQWTQIGPIRWLYDLFQAVYRLFQRVSDVLTNTLEGEGGLLWSFLLLVLIISILSTRGQ